MKILIIYSTKWGVSKACAQMLADRLTPSFDITVCDIQDTPPSPEAFEVAVIGGSIRMGKLNKKLKRTNLLTKTKKKALKKIQKMNFKKKHLLMKNKQKKLQSQKEDVQKK